MISEATGSAADLRSNYLNLLITELRHQDPLEPMDNSQMTAQLAQLSQLELLESMNQTFEQALSAARLNDATDILGKVVTFFPADSDVAVSGKVQSVKIEDGDVFMQVGPYFVSFDEITSITDGTAD